MMKSLKLKVSNHHPLPSGGGAQGSSGPAAGWGKNFQGGGGGQDEAYSCFVC